MSLVNAYLRQLATQSQVDPQERRGIETSIATLTKRLAEEFERGVITKNVVFGSYARNTMLPRWMDQNSDVDFMVVFSDRGLQPQAYLDRLKRFTERRYPRSPRYQDHPTVALDMNHIRVELVPATESSWAGIQIPAKGTVFKWIATSPHEFSQNLDRVDQHRKELIRPLIRIAKYWNARAGYVFESYELEQKVVAHSFAWVPETLEAYFYSFMQGLDVSYFDAQWRKDRIASLKQALAEVQTLKAQLNSGGAVHRLAKLLPPKDGVIFPDIARLLANWPRN